MPLIVPPLQWHHKQLNLTTVPALQHHANIGNLTQTKPPKNTRLVTARSAWRKWMSMNMRQTLELKAGDGKSGRRAKKAGQYVLPLIFLSFSFIFSCSFTNYCTSIYSRKTAVDKNRDVASFQDNNCPLSRLVFFFPPLCPHPFFSFFS